MPTQDEKYAVELLKTLIAGFKQASTVDNSVRPSYSNQSVLFKSFHEHACRWVLKQDSRYVTLINSGYVSLQNSKACVQSVSHAVDLQAGGRARPRVPRK